MLLVRKTPLKTKNIWYEMLKATTTGNRAAAKLFLRLLHLVQFLKCWQLFLELNSKDCIEVQEKKTEVVVLCSLPLQNVKLGRHSDGNEMYKKEWCMCKVVVFQFLAVFVDVAVVVTYKLLYFTQKCTEGPKHVGAQHPFVCSFVCIWINIIDVNNM